MSLFCLYDLFIEFFVPFYIFTVLHRSLESSPLFAQGTNTDCLLMEFAFCMKKVLMREYQSTLISPVLVERANGQCPGEGEEGNGERESFEGGV